MAKRRPPTRRVNSGNGHYYVVDGSKWTGRGVTTLLKGMAKDALIGWAARVTAEAAVHERDVWLPMVDKGQERRAVDYLKEARWQSSTEAAVRGTDVHKLAERLAAGETVDVDDRTSPFVDAYLDFREVFRPTDEITERVVLNRTHVYVGTFDLVADLEAISLAEWLRKTGKDPSSAEDRPVRLLVDYKTGKGVYPEAALQLAAYRYAETMLPGLEAETVEDEEPMIPVDGCAVLSLRPDDGGSYELVPVRAEEREFRTFLYAAQIAPFVGKDGWGSDTIGRAIEPGS